jgi:c-di-GMP-binding flagellar brake protein YcgR
VRLSRQSGVIERTLSLFHMYPFRCQVCGHRFLTRQPGKTYNAESDKREYARVRAQFPLMFKSKDTEGKGRLSDLSIRGCAFESDTPLIKGEVVQVILKMPDGRPPVEIEAAVVRYAQAIRFGIEFLRMPENAEKALRQFVEERLKQQAR